MSAANFAKLQRVQNTLARVLQRRSEHDHITPALIQLHWLPIQQRVTYKLATITFKTLSSDEPSYLRILYRAYFNCLTYCDKCPNSSRICPISLDVLFSDKLTFFT